MRVVSRVKGAVIAVGAVLVFATGALAVDECCIAGGTCHSSSGFPYSAGSICPGGNLCGCTISGTNCRIRLTADASTSSGDCVTIGRGVEFDMNQHEIACTGTQCGYAIKNTDSAGSSQKVTLKNGFISGCWDAAVRSTAGTNSTVDGILVDMGTSGCSGGVEIVSGWTTTVGIMYPKGIITNSQVHNAGAGMVVTEDVENSVVQDNGVGIVTLPPSSTAMDITSVLFRGNDIQYERLNNYGADFVQTTFVGAGSCNCALHGTGCQPSVWNCGDLTGADANIICEGETGSQSPVTCQVWR